MHDESGCGELQLHKSGSARAHIHSMPMSPGNNETINGSMDSPLISNVFRRLLSHQTCSRLRYHTPAAQSLPPKHSGRRHYRISNNEVEDESRQTSDWQQRTDIFPPDKLRDYGRYPMVTADALRNRRERPKRVKMLARDFIEGITVPIEGLDVF